MCQVVDPKDSQSAINLAVKWYPKNRFYHASQVFKQ